LLQIDTVVLLKEVHSALRECQRTGDIELLAAAESVLSALVVVIRHEQASVPDAVGPYIVTLVKRRRR
jgi:hypothetical protein